MTDNKKKPGKKEKVEKNEDELKPSKKLKVKEKEIKDKPVLKLIEEEIDDDEPFSETADETTEHAIKAENESIAIDGPEAEEAITETETEEQDSDVDADIEVGFKKISVEPESVLSPDNFDWTALRGMSFTNRHDIRNMKPYMIKPFPLLQSMK